MEFTTDQWIQISVAIGTIAVAILAIWGQKINYILGIRPKLNVELHNDYGEFFPLNNPKIRYYHIRTWNSNKWIPATNARVVISAVATPIANGSFREKSFIGPLQLMWRFEKYHPQFTIIGPEAICDLGFITEHQFTFTTYVVPTNFLNNLTAQQKVRIEVKALADNAESKPIYLEIAWNGKWSDDTLEMQKHLVIRQVSSMDS